MVGDEAGKLNDGSDRKIKEKGTKKGRERAD